MNNISLAKADFPEIQESYEAISKSFLELYWHYLAIGSICILLLGVALYYILKPKPKKISAYEKAMMSLNELRESECDDKTYTSNLSYILRSFLEEEYSIPALGRTTPEFMKLAGESSLLDDGIKENLAKLLEVSDMLKFARQNIDREQREALWGIARGIIENSKEQKENK